MRTRVSIWVFLAVVLMAVSAPPVAAQSAAGGTQVGAGYQLLHIPDSTSQLGFNVDVSREVSEPWRVLGEFGITHFGSDDLDTGSADIAHFGGGVRFERAFSARVSGFGQALVGLERASGETDTDWAFMLQPGAGIFASIGPAWGVVVQGDFRPVFFEEEVDEQFRLVLGVRLWLP